MIPTHVRQHRIRQGLVDAHGIGPKAKSGHCAGCGIVVLAGWTDGNRAGAWTAIVTPQPLTSLGELWATLAGLTTYAHQVRADSSLERRRPEDIIRWPADLFPDTPVYVEHRCGMTLPPTRPIPRFDPIDATRIPF
jgi:hypothetical protein